MAYIAAIARKINIHWRKVTSNRAYSIGIPEKMEPLLTM